MTDTEIKTHVERFITFFSDPDNLSRLKGAGTLERVREVLSGCPVAALALLDRLLRSRQDLAVLTEKAGLGALSAEATKVLDRLSPLKDELLSAMESGTRQQTRKSDQGVTELSFRPVFAVMEKRVEISFTARTGGREYFSTYLPDVFLWAFTRFGESLKAGWEGMRGMGWSMDSDQAAAFSALLRDCAKTVEQLSLLLPSDAEKPEGTPEAGE
jgi:hypothetical protein